MTKFTTFSRGLAASAVVAILGTAAMAQEVTLKLHQFLPAQASVPKHVLDVWADKVEADSKGRIKIERYPSMQLGGRPPELVDQVIDGIADIIWTLPGYTPGRFPSTEVFELPFMMTNAEATSRAYWDLAEKHFMDTDFADFKMLGLWVHGPGVIHSTDPVTTPADLNGVKLRAPTRMTNKLFTELGATTVGMPVPAVPEALSKGVIDATVIPWEVTSSLKVGELVHNHTEFGKDSVYTATFIFAMNKGKYDALPDDLKKVIDDNSGADFSAFAGKVMQDYDAPARNIAMDLGNTIITLTPEQVDVWRQASAGIEGGWIDEMSAEGMDAKALVEEAKALIAEYTK
ncbi:TRAP transporter substrate-binding protein [Pseudooceanicola sp.]|uniref:TRAP transporter substrate-binding protein n=1 Tax=Pseudooceanicola sp. TaxID=1914328 RepID=UPI00261BAEB1|nr:TRAP transporter substrate-binding protein [Pseudooceanicola sp.]MDF1855205.1 TRAP transporter substrate-binding protein [Pseudooceanicola sp.]